MTRRAVCPPYGAHVSDAAGLSNEAHSAKLALQIGQTGNTYTSLPHQVLNALPAFFLRTKAVVLYGVVVRLCLIP